MSNQALNETLLAAVRDNRIDLVKQTLQAGVSLAYTDWAGYTALHHSASKGDTHIEITRLLVSYGANVNANSKLRKCPLHLACQIASSEIIKLLIENGADINSQDILQMTPFHWIIQRNDLGLVQFLCDNTQVDFDLCDKFGRSCLAMATNQAILQLLQSALQRRNDSIFHIVKDLKNVAGSSSSCMNTSKPNVQRSAPQIRKNYVFEDLDSDNSDGELGQLESKKTRISSSPVQDVEGTLLWLQNQAMANVSDDEGEREFYLTEAGVMTLEYMNRIDPIGDEQRLLLKLAKGLEPNQSKNQEEEEIDTEMGKDWNFSEPFNLDSLL